MAHELDDIEKEEAVKEWLRKNVPVIIIGVVGGLVGVFGWNHYQQGQLEHRGQAAGIYQSIMEMDDAAQRLELAQTLRSDFSDTPYAAIGAMELARQLLDDEENNQAAADHLQWVVDNAGEPALVHLAAVRLARVQLAMGNHDQALATLDSLDSPDGFSALIAHVRGDALLAKGEHDQAREAYQQALIGDGQGGMNRNIVEMKLNELGAEAT